MADIKEEDIKVIFEDADLLVIDKPAGWVTTRENYKPQITNHKLIEEWIRKFRPNGLSREGICHRLDKGTSGVLVTAKNDEALKRVREQFAKRSVEKYYLAMAGGDLPEDGGITMPIERSAYVFGRFQVGVEGKRAMTEFVRLNKLRIEGKIFSLIRVRIRTGRTHQIRVHLRYLGWPLLGDTLYGGMKLAGLDRPFLHAYQTAIEHPKSGKRMEFEALLPADLESIIGKYAENN